jgi:anti-anti-sigma factor
MAVFTAPQDLSEFALTRADELPVRVVVVQGELDIATGPQLEALLAELPAVAPVVVDLCDTTFMDSSGLRVLLRVDAHHRGQFHVACSPSGPAQRAIDLAAAGVLNAHADRASAVAAART